MVIALLAESQEAFAINEDAGSVSVWFKVQLEPDCGDDLERFEAVEPPLKIKAFSISVATHENQPTPPNFTLCCKYSLMAP